MRNAFAGAMISCFNREDYFFLTGDLGFMALEEVRAAFGSRFINAGVAEQNMIGVAAGLAREGWDLMGDDAAILSDPDTRPRVRPTYRRLSLWEDSARALLGRHEPLGYKHEEDLAEPSDPGATRPLAALFILERAGVTAPVHRALPPAAATMAIVANSFALDPAEPGFVRRRLAQAGALRDRVPVLAFDYPRRYDAFAAARAALARILEGLT